MRSIGYDSDHNYNFNCANSKRVFNTSYFARIEKDKTEIKIDDLLMDYDNFEVELSFLDKNDLHYGVVESQLEDIEKELNSLGFYFKED